MSVFAQRTKAAAKPGLIYKMVYRDEQHNKKQRKRDETTFNALIKS